MVLKIYNMKLRFTVILSIILAIQLFWWWSIVVPKSSFFVPETVNKVLTGAIPLRMVYQDKNLFKEVYMGLGNETPIGLQFDTLATRFTPLKRKNKLKVPNYYTLNDWALGMLYAMPLSNLPNKPDPNWSIEVSRLQYQIPLKPVYGQENESFDKNKELISKWKVLLNSYLN